MEPNDKVSLRFRDVRTEDFFVKSNHNQVVTNTCVVAAVVATVNVGRWALLLINNPFRDTHEARRTRLLIFTVEAGVLTLCSIVLAAALFKPLRRRLCVRATEVLVVLFMVVMSPSMFLMDKYYAPKTLGYDPDGIFTEAQHWSDTRVVLSQCVIILTSHLVLPIRWIMLIPLEVVCVVTYAGFGLMVGSPDGVSTWNALLIFVILVGISVLGRRTIEIHQRESLAQLIRERTARAETEFKLSRAEAKARSDPLADPIRGSPDARSEGDRCSRPDTTATSHALMDGNDLARITQIAREERWLIEHEELHTKPQEVLGSGGYGKVISGYFSYTSVAVKMTRMDLTEADEGDRKAWIVDLLNEIRILRHVRHPNVVQFYGATIDEQAGDVRLVLELVKGPCLESLILKGGGPTRALQASDQFKAITDTCRALCYLHSRKPSIVHGDLKGTNIIMELDPCLPGRFRAKLLDFGLARKLTRNPEPMGGTLMWVAPEVVRNPRKVGLSADFFSFGRLAFFVLTGIFPFFRGAAREVVISALRDNALPPLPWPRVNLALIAECRPWVELCSSATVEDRLDMPTVMRYLSQTAARLSADFDVDIGGLPEPLSTQEGEMEEPSLATGALADPSSSSGESTAPRSEARSAASEASNLNFKLRI
mmetsp:Transcript_36166/g.112609  ORF Transcript_36166/g.112609 Transcript_36166/m.112609 type:complete len:654 (-) Transcript_36166:8-1969(-)